jgi:hypothetical protein
MSSIVVAEPQALTGDRRPKKWLSKDRKRLALAIALAADVLQLALAPFFAEGALSPLDDLLDVAVAVAISATLGWRKRTMLALALELIPGVALFPSWTAVVASIRSDD